MGEEIILGIYQTAKPEQEREEAIMKKIDHPIFSWIVSMVAVLLLVSMVPMSSYADAGNGKSSSNMNKHKPPGAAKKSLKPCTGPANRHSEKSGAENKVNLEAASQLIERWLPCDQARQFKLQSLDPSKYDKETFEINGGPGQHITISGSSTSALLMGWNWYLKYVAHTNISMNGKQLNLPEKLPMPDHPIQHHANVQHRFALNDTDEGYTDPYEDWEHWQRKIDVLAMHGINEVLVYPGQEAVYEKTFEDFGYSASEMRKWIPQPAHQPWWLLQNMSGYPNPIPQSVIDKRVTLGKKIADRLRKLGMTPVFPGYYGTVPFHFNEKNPGAHIVPQGNYHTFQRSDWLDPTNEWFPKVAAAFYKHQSELFGDTTMYKMDLLHEGGQAGDVDIKEASKAVQEALDTAHPGAIWAILGWQSNPRKETIAAVDKSKMLVVDGLSERDSAKDRDADWDHTPYAFGTIWNFGGHTNMGANLTVWNKKFHEWLNKQDSKLSGTALMPEAINNNPAAMEFFTEMAWHDNPVDMSQWFTQYAESRYGGADTHATAAWQTILETVYNLPANNSSEQATELYSVEPSLTALTTTGHFNANLYYDKAKFEKALTELLKVDPKLRDTNTYRYDLMDVTRQVLANKGRELLPKIKAAYSNGDKHEFDKLSARWLHYIKLTDKVTATNKQSMLEPWLENARSWAANDEERKQLEYDARSLITIWGTEGLEDYARRQWAGLVGDYYYSRWKSYFDSLATSLETGQPPKPIDWHDFGEKWAHKTNRFPSEPSGNVFEIANDIHKELTDQPQGSLEVSANSTVINSDKRDVTVSATFTNQNGLAEARDVKFTLNAPAGYTADAQTAMSTEVIAPGDTFTVKWNVTAPENTSAQAAAKFSVDASYKTGNQTDKVTDSTRVLVENDVQSPNKTISFNDAKFSQSGDDFAIYGGGNDMWKGTNEYGAIYKEKAFGSSDTVTTKVVHQDRTGPYARAGIVARNDLTKQSGSAGYVNIAVTPDHGCMLSWDSNGDGTLDSKANETSFTTAVYVKLSRNGSLFTGSCSMDGKSWKDVGTVNVPGANAEEDVGLFMTAANGSGDSTGITQFKGFSIKAQQLLLQLPHRKVPAGIPVNVTALFRNEEDQSIQDMTTSLQVPDDWNVKAVTPTEESDIAPGDTVKVTWKVTAPKHADIGHYNLKASATYTIDKKKETLESTLPVDLITTADQLSSAFNNIGITDDENPGPGNLDGGNSFSAQALAKEGLTPGAIVTHDGVSFKWPDVPAGKPDNVAGEAAIRTSTMGNWLAFIGAGVFDQTGTGAVVYSDGSVKEFTVNFPNYASPKPSGSNVVARFDYRNTPSGPANFGHNYQVLYDAVTLDPDKEVVAVILPDNPRIHIFSMSVVSTSAADMKQLVDYFDKNGEFESDDAAHALKIHLTAVSHYEEKQLAEKVVKQMKNFKVLLDHQKENQLISNSAYNRLKADADYLIEKWN